MLPIAVESLTKDFGSIRAVDDLSFAVEPGRVVALGDRPPAHLEALADSGLLVGCAAVGRGLPEGHAPDAEDVGLRRAALEEMKRQVADAGRLGAELPIRPLCRQLIETGPVSGLPANLPMVVEAETGFHFRRRDDRLVLAMVDPAPRWGFEETVDESLVPDRLERLARRYPPADGAAVARAWAGLYDMTPDAHPVIGAVGDGVSAACGLSGPGFMQSPAVGRAVAEEILTGDSALDLSPYRPGRFEGVDVPAEELLL